jgi:hypothetical protein
MNAEKHEKECTCKKPVTKRRKKMKKTKGDRVQKLEDMQDRILHKAEERMYKATGDIASHKLDNYITSAERNKYDELGKQIKKLMRA